MNKETDCDEIKNAEINNDPRHILPVVIRWQEPESRRIEDSSSESLRSYEINLI